MSPPNTYGDTPVPDSVTTHQLLLGLHGRMDRQDKDLEEIKRFFKGDTAQGTDGAVSRLNSHSKDIATLRDKHEETNGEIRSARNAAFAALWAVVIGLLSFLGITVWNKAETKAHASEVTK